MWKSKVECEACHKEFEVEVLETEDHADAVWMSTCVRCGIPLCPSCHASHECRDDEEMMEDDPETRRVKIKCDVCQKTFEVEVDSETTDQDAECDASCGECNLTLCPTCYKNHNCPGDGSIEYPRGDPDEL